MNDKQVIVTVIGLAGVAYFMLQPGSKPDLSPARPVFPAWYPQVPTRSEGDTKPPRKSGYEANQLRLSALADKMQKYATTIVGKYIQDRALVFDSLNHSRLEGPMREDLRTDVVELKKLCISIGRQWIQFLNEKSRLDHDRSIQGYAEYGLVRTLTQNYWTYEQALNFDSAQINEEQSRGPETNVQYFVQNIAKFTKQQELSVSFDQMMLVDTGAQAYEPSFDTSPSSVPPSQAETESQEYTGAPEGLPHTVTDVTGQHNSQPGFVADGLPPTVSRDMIKAAEIAPHGKTSSERTRVKGGGPKPSPIVILDEVPGEPDAGGFNSSKPLEKVQRLEDSSPKRPPRKSRSLSPGGRSSSRDRGRTSSDTSPERKSQESPEKKSLKRSREMDAAPDPHNSQLEDYEAKRPRKGIPTEFSANQKPGGDEKKKSKALTGHVKPNSPDVTFVGFITRQKELFTEFESNADEDSAGVYYWEARYADPTGDNRGRYWSAIANANEGGMRAIKQGNYVFFRLASYSLEKTVGQLQGHYTVAELNDILASPEFEFYKTAVVGLKTRMKRLVVLSRGQGKKPLTQDVYKKNAARVDKELRRRLRVKRL